jgi:hypothetical protein
MPFACHLQAVFVITARSSNLVTGNNFQMFRLIGLHFFKVEDV